MAQCNAVYIPQDQKSFYGRADEIAGQFWKLGIFLITPSEKYMSRLQRMRFARFLLPRSRHKFSYGDIGLADEGKDQLFPSEVDAKCPKCGAWVVHEFYEAANQVLGSGISILDVSVSCSTCTEVFPARLSIADPPNFIAARFYLFVNDIDPDFDWEPSFKQTVESVLGPCTEIIAYET